MTARQQYAPMIMQEIEDHFPELLRDFAAGYLWIHAQIWQESRWNPQAESEAGACGLMQLMPPTDFEIDGDYDCFDSEGNIDNGVRYMAFLYSRFGEILDDQERICFALASYNGGRRYINEALALARSAEGLPFSFKRWVFMGRPGGRWQKWDVTKTFLADPRCEVNGRRPDHRQICDYVDRIVEKYREYLHAEVNSWPQSL